MELIALAGVLLTAGIALIWFGARARYCYPICHCGYDLRGAPSERARCPECGAPINRRRVTIANFNLTNLGILLILLALLGIPLALLVLALPAL